MLYPTHIRTGYLFGFATAILFSSTIYLSNAQNGFSGLVMSIILTMSGAAFGSGFPDIDSPKSIPTKRHPIFKMIFNFFGIQHRGKFSHSVASETIFWAAIFGVFYFILHQLQGIDSQTSAAVMLGIRFLFGCALGTQISFIASAVESLANSKIISFSGLANFILFLMTDDKQYAKIAQYRKPNEFQQKVITLASYLVGFGLVLFIMPISGNNKVVLVNNATYYIFVYIIGIWAGVMSHMLMDISTREGIFIFWKTRISPAKQMERIPILKLFVPNNQFRTGTGWETIVRIIVSTGDIALFIILIFEIIKMIQTGLF